MISVESKIGALGKQYLSVRKMTEAICHPLEKEDYVVQPALFVSPPKWHLGHTTWFFEQFVLSAYKKNYKTFHPDYNYVFNSYYETLGNRVLRTDRGNLTRPSVEEVYKYRDHVDHAMLEFLDENREIDLSVFKIIELGLNHEQQHQELLVYDIKYILGNNPLFPPYKKNADLFLDGWDNKITENYIEIPQGIYEIGHQEENFCYDNELGRHQVFLHGFRILDRLITNREYLAFIEAGGYQDFRYWMMEGWDWVKQNKIQAPLYWHRIENQWKNYVLSGLSEINWMAPVTHISFYEADAFARWKGKRLLTEFEWEASCRIVKPSSTKANFLESKNLQPIPREENSTQLLGDAWEWTNSAYLPYPFYVWEQGALGEYNGKFMINQMVLRGGSCATPKSHMRISYRNFFHPEERWMFSGIRLGESV